MGCIYSNFQGQCTLCIFNDNEEFVDSGIIELGGQIDGICVCEDDPDPSCTCDSYESDGNDDC